MSSLKVIKVLLLAMLFLMANSFLKANALAETVIYLPSDKVVINPCKLGECKPEHRQYNSNATKVLISDAANINELKEMLARLESRLLDIDKNLVENDKNAMKAQDIILRARAAGNEKAGKVAEEALRKAQGTKEELLKEKESTSSMVKTIRDLLTEAEKYNCKNPKEVCEQREKEFKEITETIKDLLRNAEKTKERFEERIKEVYKEGVELFMDITPIPFDLISNTEYYEKMIGNEKIKNMLSDLRLKTEGLQKGMDVIKGAYISIKIGEILNKKDEIKELESRLQYAVFTANQIEADIEKLKQESADLTEDVAVKTVVLFLDELAKSVGKNLTLLGKIAPILSTIEAAWSIRYHAVKIHSLDKGIEEDYKLTDEQLMAMNALIEQHKRSFQKVKECKEMMGER